jgi:excinuclease ABC subunit B
MLAAAEELEFERAAAIRDRIAQMRNQLGKPLSEAEIHHATRAERGKHRRQPPVTPEQARSRSARRSRKP